MYGLDRSMGFLKNIKQKRKEKILSSLADQIKTKIYGIEIPILIISYNNACYVENMVSQLNTLGITPIIIDNHSTDSKSIQVLKKLDTEKTAHVVFSSINFGYRVGFMSKIYDVLPQFFGYTDPDLQFKQHIDSNFIYDFKRLTEKYKIFKVGCALELSEDVSNTMFMEVQANKFPIETLSQRFLIKEWEGRYWNLLVKDEEFELYSAPIDTTFAIYNKEYYFYNIYDALRVAGNYSVYHLPWYPEMDIMKKDEEEEYMKNNNSNTWMR